MAPNTPFRFADVAVTPTAPEFQGIYRGRPHHDPDFDAVLDRAIAAGVQRILLTCMSLRDIDPLLEICRRRPSICSMTAGVHPYHATEPWDEAPNYLGVLRARIRELMREESSSPVRALGELGLDYDRTQQASREVQIQTFRAQLDMLVEEKWSLPLFLHCRNSCEDFIDVLKPYIPLLPRGGLVHSFVGTREEMQSLVHLGLDISVNGFAFRDEASLDMVRALPMDRLQIETDAPWGYISPRGEWAIRFPSPVALATGEKKRDRFEMGLRVKERNESCAIAQVAGIVAGLKGVAVEEVVERAWENSGRMFWGGG